MEVGHQEPGVLPQFTSHPASHTPEGKNQMDIVLSEHGYGESSIPLILVSRSRHTDRVRRLSVDVRLTGGIPEVFTDGRNEHLLSTNAISNTVYALSADHADAEPEEFALTLCRHFLVSSPSTESVEVTVTATEFAPMGNEENSPRHSFRHIPAPRATSRAVGHGGENPCLWSGISGLELFKTTGSTFTGFRQDKYLTIQPFVDRVFGVELTAEWQYRDAEQFDGSSRARAQEAIHEEFAAHISRSSQHTLHRLVEAVIGTCPEVCRVRMAGAHLTRGLVDLSPFHVDNPGIVYTATEHQTSPLAIEVTVGA
ncbi:urate oxidase [Streptomyces sp. ICN441]|nr:urate oxidase [Streptomyces sp. ICN441]